MSNDTIEDPESTIALSFEELVGSRETETRQLPVLAKRAYLVSDLDHNPPRMIAIGAGLLVGRTGFSTLEIDDPSVSRRHARIYRTPEGEYILEDLGSTNGTMVNGIRRKEHLLLPGDRIQFGRTKPYLVNFHSLLEDALLEMQRVEMETKWASGVAMVLRSLHGPLQECLAGQGHSDLTPHLAAIEHIAQGLADSIEKLLVFSGSLGRNLVPLNLSSLLRSVAMNLKLARAVTIVTDVSGDLWVKGDNELLARAFQELGANAVEAMPDGGRIEITTRAVSLDLSSIYEKPHLAGGHTAVVTIADTGVGIAPAIRRKLLSTPFLSTKAKQAGAGLGVLMAHRIIQVHFGYLELHCREHKGTECEVYLPLIEEPDDDLRL